MKAIAIVNPRAGGRRRSQRAQRAATKLRAAGVDDIITTRYPGHAEQLALAVNADLVIAVGGDGIVHEAVNGLMARPHDARPQLAVIPCGSGNDFAYACGIREDTDAAIEHALRGRPHPVDVAHIRDDAGRARWFANSAGLLFDGAVNMHSHRMPCGGFLKYALATAVAIARSYAPNTITLTLDGDAHTEPLVMLTIANGPREGGRFLCAPHARNDDGQLDLMTASPVSRFAMLRLLPKVMKGTHVDHPALRLTTARDVTIAGTAPMPIHLDGELWVKPSDGVRNLTVHVEPAALMVRHERRHMRAER